MGIPQYFQQIIRKFPEIITKTLEPLHKQHLYLDFNCLIHPCCGKILSDLKTHAPISKERIEKKCLNEIGRYLKLICANHPSLEKLVISIDGVAPQAKMVQQRSRRFRSIPYKEELRLIGERHHMIPNNSWDSNAITPGTEFMFMLSSYLTHLFKKDPELSKIPIKILSDASVPGEGEHKILEHLRTQTEPEETDTIVYGLDADLIMLAMASGYSNISLLREAVHFGKVQTDSFLYLQIPQFKQYLLDELLVDLTDEQRGLMRATGGGESIIQDYIFLCFLIGNDFLPRLPSLNIRQGAIDYLLGVYKKLLLSREEYLICNGEINIGFLKNLLQQLSYDEQTKIQEQHKIYYKKRFRHSGYGNGTSAYEQEVRELDHLPLINKHDDMIQPEKENWKARYYYSHFKLKNVEKEKGPIQEICRLYLSGLAWTAAYYFKGCTSWKWAYYYNSVPCLEELIEMLDIIDINSQFREDNSKPVQPFQQLLCVLPPQSKYLLPSAYQQLMTSFESPIIHYYPEKINMHSYLAYYYYNQEPNLPFLYREDIIDSTKEIKLNKKETELNSLGKVQIYKS
jgi:5'-3' exonuclease